MTPAAETAEAKASRPSPSLPAKRQYAWKRNPVFKFLSSVRLAVLLLLVLIVGCIFGTIWESSFDARVARAYMYEAPWFNVWLFFLGINLAFAAFSRWPWKKHHTGFLITHLGIIILLCGSVIGKIWGVEGSIVLHAGEAPANELVTDKQHLLVQDGQNVARSYPISIINRKPTPERPWDLGVTENGWHLELIDYSLVKPLFRPRASAMGGVPAVHLILESPRLGQKMDHWLMADGSARSSIDLSIASVQFKQGTPPPSAPPPATVAGEKKPVEEAIFVYANAPEKQVSHAMVGTTTNTNVTLELQEGKPKIKVRHAGAKWTFDFEQFRGKEVDLGGSGLRLFFEDYWPDFEMKDGKPHNRSDQPVNPAAMVRVRGMQEQSLESTASAGVPEDKELKLEIWAGADGKLRYRLFAGKPEPISGELTQGQALATGWADWKATLVETIPSAMQYTEFLPQESGEEGRKMGLRDALKIRLSKGGTVKEEWVPAGWQSTLPMDDSKNPPVITLYFGQKVIRLPIVLQLEKFHVEHNEGGNSPASFKSDILAQDSTGRAERGSCWMNHPMNFPGDWWRGWTGHTYKMSQASWNPEDLNQSTIQILRDPGWSLKWIGSLLICLGIYTMFYLRPYPQFQKKKKA